MVENKDPEAQWPYYPPHLGMSEAFLAVPWLESVAPVVEAAYLDDLESVAPVVEAAYWGGLELAAPVGDVVGAGVEAVGAAAAGVEGGIAVAD